MFTLKRLAKANNAGMRQFFIGWLLFVSQNEDRFNDFLLKTFYR